MLRIVCSEHLPAAAVLVDVMVELDEIRDALVMSKTDDGFVVVFADDVRRQGSLARFPRTCGSAGRCIVSAHVGLCERMLCSEFGADDGDPTSCNMLYANLSGQRHIA